ncbi:MAG: truA [Gammaproteobacteria bacterium]|jgi:tRNA pseudouridine38-40 synthase|nr:truA [Gammaproteobacteria bacterium]
MRIALGIEYNGYTFFGWQTQKNLPTIQGSLESALSQIADEPITLCCAGRTDAGVHATGQIAHFDTQAVRSMRAWTWGPNALLPPAIAVCWAKEVSDDFHARYSAVSRCYRYIISNDPARPAILAGQVAWHYDVLNIAMMQQAANYLIGEHDFSAFRSAQCESKTPMRNVQLLHITRDRNYIIFEIMANAFLHHMVRNIVGTLLQVGAGFKEPEWVQAVLNSQDRRQAGATAAAAGLYLIQVRYSDSYSLPLQSRVSVPR